MAEGVAQGPAVQIATIKVRRGMPEQRPPYPAAFGLWECPTAVNSLETLANVPVIFALFWTRGEVYGRFRMWSVGLLLLLLGVAIRIWAQMHLRNRLVKTLEFTSSGPYQLMRNPLYIGTLTVAAGFVLASRQWVLGVLFAAVFLLIYLPVVELEEQHLRSLFPQYSEYARRVPRLWPRLIGNSSKPFRSALYMRNREYQALAGFLIGVAVLIWKVA